MLEELEMYLCHIYADISSQSLKYLYMDISFFGLEWEARTSISAPNLVGFRLGVYGGMTPLLNTMPSLVTASVILGETFSDYCCCCDLPYDECHGEASDINRSVALKGLSGTTDLKVIISRRAMFIFRNNFEWGHMFSKLKTLLLRDWCLSDDFTGLVYFLQHSSILETLTINLKYCHPEQQLVFEPDESYNPSEQLLVSKHLKVVTILCQTREDEEIPHILKILGAHGVLSKQIVIQSMDEEN